MVKANALIQNEGGERQKEMTWKNFKKELERVTLYKCQKHQTTFRAKHRDATYRWREQQLLKNEDIASQ